MSPTAMTRERKGYEGRGTREEGEDKNEGRGDESGRMLTHLLSTGRRSPFNFMNRGTAIIYLMPLVPRYTTIYMSGLVLGRGWRTRTNEEERKTAICESSTPTNPASVPAPRARRARGSTVYISVYKRGETRPICTNNPTHIAELVCNAEFSPDSSY